MKSLFSSCRDSSNWPELLRSLNEQRVTFHTFFFKSHSSRQPSSSPESDKGIWTMRRWEEGGGRDGGRKGRWSCRVTGPCHWRALSIGPLASQDPVTVAIEAPERQMAAEAQRRSLTALNVSITGTYIKSLKDKRVVERNTKPRRIQGRK